MKIYCRTYNGILDQVKSMLESTGELTNNPHEGDVFLTWQDVRGFEKEIADIYKYSIKKPVIVVQHGRGATRDYGPPNNFELLADKICVWGQSEKDRLLKYGVLEDKIIVVGCPLFPYLKKQNKNRAGINILYVPVISTKEEPENLLVHAYLKIWESEKLIENLNQNFDDFKRAWAYELREIKDVVLPNGKTEERLFKTEVKSKLPRDITYKNGLINVKLTGVHDIYQYTSALIMLNQDDPNNISEICNLLTNIDLMVCLEEGTMQLLASMLNIPVVVVNIFNYRNYGGVENYDTIEKIKTDSCYFLNNLSKLGDTIDYVLKHSNEKTNERIKVCEYEGGANILNPVEQILNVVNSYRPITERLAISKA